MPKQVPSDHTVPPLSIWRPVIAFTVSAIVFFSAIALAGVPLHEVAMRFDGASYCGIADDGYEYASGLRSNLAFFPAYPLMVRLMSRYTPLSTVVAALLLANTATLLSLVAVEYYNAIRRPFLQTSLLTSPAMLMALYPTAFFFHLAYSEATFVLLLSLFLVALRKNVPLLVLAVICGAGTAVRPVGVAMVPVVIWRAWLSERSLAYRIVTVLVACSGLAAFMLYQQVVFGDCLVFARTQQYYSTWPAIGGVDKIVSLMSLEPLWSTYLPGTWFYWKRFGSVSPTCSLQFANPILFVVAVSLVAYGWRRSWLSREEIILAALLPGIPYVTRAYEMTFNSQGRFCAVVVPMFIVASNWLGERSIVTQALILASLLAFYAHYCVLFARGAYFF